MTRILMIVAIALTAQTAAPAFAGNAGNANIIAPNNYTPISKPQTRGPATFRFVIRGRR